MSKQAEAITIEILDKQYTGFLVPVGIHRMIRQRPGVIDAFEFLFAGEIFKYEINSDCWHHNRDLSFCLVFPYVLGKTGDG